MARDSGDHDTGARGDPRLELRPGGPGFVEKNIQLALKKACAILGLDNDHMYSVYSANM